MENEGALSLPRYIVVHGCIISIDFIDKLVTDEQKSKIDLSGVNILKISKPTPSLIFTTCTFLFSTNSQICDFVSKKTPFNTEKFVLSKLMLQLDPSRKYDLRSATMFIDTKESGVTVVQIISTAEAKLVDKRYARLRIGDTPSEIAQSRMIRCVSRLSTTTSSNTEDQHCYESSLPHPQQTLSELGVPIPTPEVAAAAAECDPDDLSGTEGAIAVLAREEERADLKQKAAENKKESRSGEYGHHIDAIHRVYKTHQELNQLRFLSTPQIRAKYSKMPRMRRRSRNSPYALCSPSSHCQQPGTEGQWGGEGEEEGCSSKPAFVDDEDVIDGCLDCGDSNGGGGNYDHDKDED